MAEIGVGLGDLHTDLKVQEVKGRAQGLGIWKMGPKSALIRLNRELVLVWEVLPH